MHCRMCESCVGLVRGCVDLVEGLGTVPSDSTVGCVRVVWVWLGARVDPVAGPFWGRVNSAVGG